MFEESELNQSSLKELSFSLEQTLIKALKFEEKATEETKAIHSLYPTSVF
jgi:hypothetical protein